MKLHACALCPVGASSASRRRAIDVIVCDRLGRCTGARCAGFLIASSASIEHPHGIACMMQVTIRPGSAVGKVGGHCIDASDLGLRSRRARPGLSPSELLDRPHPGGRRRAMDPADPPGCVHGVHPLRAVPRSADACAEHPHQASADAHGGGDPRPAALPGAPRATRVRPHRAGQGAPAGHPRADAMGRRAPGTAGRSRDRPARRLRGDPRRPRDLRSLPTPSLRPTPPNGGTGRDPRGRPDRRRDTPEATEPGPTGPGRGVGTRRTRRSARRR